MARGAIEATVFLGLAAGLHLGALGLGLSAGSRGGVGSGGADAVSVSAAPAELVALVEDWRRAPDTSRAPQPPQALPQPQEAAAPALPAPAQASQAAARPRAPLPPRSEAPPRALSALPDRAVSLQGATTPPTSGPAPLPGKAAAIPAPGQESAPPRPAPAAPRAPTTDPPPSATGTAPPPPRPEAPPVTAVQPRPRPAPASPTAAAPPPDRPTPAPPPSASAPQLRAAGTGDRPVAGGGAPGPSAVGEGAEARLMSAWGREIRAAVERHKRFPAAAGRAHGTAAVRLSVDAAGRARAITLMQSAGHPALDRAALAAVRAAAPLPRAPDGLGPGPHVFRFTMRFGG